MFSLCQQSTQFVARPSDHSWWFPFSNVCSFFFFLTLSFLCSMPSPNHGSLLNKRSWFIYMVIPVRYWSRNARHIMYHHNAYAFWLIRLLIWGSGCVRVRSRHKGVSEQEEYSCKQIFDILYIAGTIQIYLDGFMCVMVQMCVNTPAHWLISILPAGCFRMFAATRCEKYVISHTIL